MPVELGALDLGLIGATKPSGGSSRNLRNCGSIGSRSHRSNDSRGHLSIDHICVRSFVAVEIAMGVSIVVVGVVLH